MSKLQWDQEGEKLYQTGVRNGVIYVGDQAAAWNGLTAFNENPSGAEATPLYANDRKYIDLMSDEQFGFGLEAYTYPDLFAECDGSKEPVQGVKFTQQTRKKFGFSVQIPIGNDTEGTAHGYEIHLVYNCLASPSTKDHGTINESPEAITFSWDVSTTPIEVEGYKPVSHIIVSSLKVDEAKMKALKDILYGTDRKEGSEGTEGRLPLPSEVLEIIGQAA